MTDVPVTLVKIYRNPWQKTLTDGFVLGIVNTAAINAAEEIAQMIDVGELDPLDDSFGAVIFDPTRPRSATAVTDKIFATIEIGPKGLDYLPNGAAKADAHDRHQVPNGDLVEHASHCLGDDDFAYGNSAEYHFAPGGGSGFSVEQDERIVFKMLKDIMDPIREARDSWVKTQRAGYGGQCWYNELDVPGAQYKAVLDMEPILVI